MNDKLSIGQKIMFIMLYVMISLMVVFSIGATKNVGQKGFDKCIEWKCQKGEEYCSKQREINNCCLGAGGQLGISENKLTCIV